MMLGYCRTNQTQTLKREPLFDSFSFPFSFFFFRLPIYDPLDHIGNLELCLDNMKIDHRPTRAYICK